MKTPFPVKKTSSDGFIARVLANAKPLVISSLGLMLAGCATGNPGADALGNWAGAMLIAEAGRPQVTVNNAPQQVGQHNSSAQGIPHPFKQPMRADGVRLRVQFISEPSGARMEEGRKSEDAFRTLPSNLYYIESGTSPFTPFVWACDLHTNSLDNWVLRAVWPDSGKRSRTYTRRELLENPNIVFKPDTGEQLEVPLKNTTNVKTFGFLQVTSEDSDDEVYVDGSFAGNAPSKLKLTEGLHVIEVRKNGFKAFKKEIRITEGSELSLRAVLQKQ